jgi:hypothetical protein
MGFYLWVDDGLAWAQGTYEYRPMGTAVISASDLFRRRDFDPRHQVRAPARSVQFVGQFASLGHLNAHLQARRSLISVTGYVTPKSRSVRGISRLRSLSPD